MTKRIMLVAVLIVVAVGLTGCSIFGGDTGVKGKLILEPGQTGDVRNARVELYQKSDLTGDPIKVVQSASEGTDLSEAEFEITDVLAGYYYLLAWKDMDGDGDISGGDLVGVYGGTYTPGEGGQQLTIEDGKMADAGNITMMIFVEPTAVAVTGTKKTDGDGYEYAEYSYIFNKDVTLSSVTLTVSGYPSYTPDTEKGTRNGDQAYTFPVYFYNGAEYEVPSGTHNLRFVGSDDEGSFDLSTDLTF